MTSISDTMPSTWAHTLVDQAAFEREQARLAHVWTFLGLAKDVTNDGDWFRASLATRSVFVQRFGDELKGFENRCAHRFYPLRTTDKGRGPIVCGFHHWRYDKEGEARGIPLCDEVYGVRPGGARLNPVEIATCGPLVFGRFPGPSATDSLEAFLGVAFPILNAMAHMGDVPQVLTTAINANWKLCLHITFDDYHGVAVHPSTFGKIGYLHRQNVTYERFGLHSTLLSTQEPNALKMMSDDCRNGTFRSRNYRVFQFMPNLIVSHFRSDAQFWHCVIQQIIPISHDRSASRAWLYPAPFPAGHARHVRWTRPFSDPVRKRLVYKYVRRVFEEDNAVCERLQAIAYQAGDKPILGALEERIAWFEESCAKIMDAEVR